MAERFLGNMSDAEYEEWKGLSKEERKELARELALEKRKAKKIKEAEDSAYWKNYRKKAMTTPHSSFKSSQPLFDETYSLETSPLGLSAKALADEKLKVTGREPIQLTDYRGQKGTSRGLSSLPDVTEDDDEDEDSFFSMKTLRDWGLTKDLNEELKKDAYKNRVITQEDHDKARALREDSLRAEEFSDAVEEPISEADQEFIDNSRKAAEFSGLSRVDDGAINPEEQAADARRFQREYEEAAFPEEPSWTRHLIAGGDKDAMEQIDKDLGKGPAGLITDPIKRKIYLGGFLKSLGAPNFMIDKFVSPITKKELDEHEGTIKKEEKKEAGMIDLTEKKLKVAETDAKKELKKIIKKEEKIEEIAPKTEAGEERFDPWMKQSEDFKLEYDPTFIAPQILEYKAAKTNVEKDAIVQKLPKDEGAAVREEADPKCFWIDPFTGFAINNCELDKRIRRKEEIELAKIFPPADRAVYLARKKIITPGDLAAMLDPTEMEQLDLLIKKQKAQEGAYTLISAKLKSEENPKRKEWLKMYINAGSNDNYGLQVLLGTKLGFGKDIMEAAQKSHLINEKAKLAAKGGGLKKAFSNAYGLEYSTVVANEMKWIDRATAIVEEKGIMSEYQLDGVTIRDRSGRFRSYGLKEQADMKKLSPKEQRAIYKRSAYYGRYIKNIDYLDEEGKFDPTKLTKDTDAYEQYLLNTLVWMAMEDLYHEKYTDMMRFVDENSFTSQKARASMEKKFTNTTD